MYLHGIGKKWFFKGHDYLIFFFFAFLQHKAQGLLKIEDY